jgi:hypothetical protein
MEEIKAPKKERKFLKAVGNIAKVLVNELVMGIGRKFIGKAIDKVGNKRQGLVITFLLVAGISYASIDSIPYPVTGNKQRLGWQTSGNGLVYRGRSNDTITKPSSYVDKNVKAYLLLDSVRGTIFVWRQTYWDSILVGGGGGAAAFTQPVDSLFFNVNVPTNNVDTAKMRWDSDLATVVLGLNDNVPNELGFKNFWLVKNQTGTTITKGSLVYANGTVGASGRITVAKFIANGSIDAKYLLGITAHDLTDGEDGYVVSFGKIRQVNTDTFAAGAILYPSPTVAGVWTDVEPVAPNIDMPIGFCINSHVNNGTIAIRVASGYKLSELHDVRITSPVDRASLYYNSSQSLWRDTTAVLLVSDTASMLLPYLRDADTVSLSNRINLKLNIADTSAFARDNQISGTSGQVAYFNSSSSVVSDTALRWSAANKSLGINVTSVPSGANLILKNSQEPVRSTIVANQTFGADTTNWTGGAGWTFNGTQAVATAATGDLTYTPALTITSGNAYEITYTLSSYSAGTLTARIGNSAFSLPTYNTTANVVLLFPTSASGGFRFTTSTFTGNLDNVSVVQVANPASLLISGQNDNSNQLYEFLRLPNNTSIAAMGGGKYLTGINNTFFGENSGTSNTTGSSNNFFGNLAGYFNTTGYSNNFFGNSAGYFNTIGYSNNFFGNLAGNNNTIGRDNNFFGSDAGRYNTAGFRNNYFGESAGRFSNSNDNNFFGTSAGEFNTTGSNLVLIGTRAGAENTTGVSNNFIGYQAGQYNTIGGFNVAIGREAGYYLRSGSYNIFLGDNSGPQQVLNDSLSGSNNLAIGRNAADNIRAAAAGNVAIGNAVDLPTNNGSNQGVYQNVLFFTGASGTGTTIAAASKAGIKTNAPNRDLEVAGEVRITDLTTDAPTRLVGADADGDLGQVTLGAGLSLAASSLLADTTFLVTRFDTASMLTNYLRTGTAASTYLTQSNAASTYLPLTGGTLTGGLNGTTGTFNTRLGVGSFAGSPLLFASGTGNQEVHFAHSQNTAGATVTLRLTNTNAGFFDQGAYFQGIVNRGINEMSGALGTNGSEYIRLRGVDDGGVVGVGIFNTNPSYNLDVTGTFRATGASLIGGTLGVTGATTLNSGLKIIGTTDIFNGQPFSTLQLIPAPTIGSTDNTIQTINTTGLSFKIGLTERMKINSSGLLTVTDAATFNSGAVFNEAATDSDFRVESEANAHMLFVDASTSKVGIGTNSPTKTLDVNGELNVLSAGTFGGRLNTNWLERTYSNSTSTSLIVSVNTTWLKLENNSTITLTLPNAATYPGKELHIKNAGTGAVNSLSSNIEPLNSTTIGTAILASGGGKWATLVSDGTYWVIMAGN